MEQKFVDEVHGVLVHRLPRECRRTALSIFARLSVRRCSQDKLGMKIFFERYDCVWRTILRRTVMVLGKSYDIYPLVTNLTIHGIRRYSDEMEIRRLVEPYGPVINIYIVEKVHTQSRTYITEDYRVVLDVPEVLANYHLNPVVLRGVEQMFPVSFFCRLCRKDGHKQYQCQAQTNCNFAKSGLMARCVSYEGCQSTCPEGDGSEVEHSDGAFRRQIHPRTNFRRQIHPRQIHSSRWTTPSSSSGYGNSTPKGRFSETRHNSNRSHQKNYATMSSRPSTSRSYHTYTQGKYSRRDSHSSERRASQNRSLGHKYFRESTGKSAPSTRYPRRTDRRTSEDIRISGKKNEIIEQAHENAENSRRGEALLQQDRIRCKGNSTSHKQSKNSAKDSIGAKMDRLGCQSGRASSSSGLTEDAPSQPSRCNTASSLRMGSKPVEDSEVDNACKTQGSSREGVMSSTADSTRPSIKTGKRKAVRLFVLTPPGINPKRVSELINIHRLCDAENLPLEVQKELAAVLDWTKGPDKPELNEMEATLIQNLEYFLAKVRSARSERVAKESVTDANPKTQAVNSKKEDGDPSSRKQKRQRSRVLYISRGVSAIIKRVQGVLKPVILETFLKQAWGRRNVVKMARVFISNIRGLINQLKDVVKSYYISGKREGEDDRVIDYVKRLSLRLERDISEDPHRH